VGPGIGLKVLTKKKISFPCLHSDADREARSLVNVLTTISKNTQKKNWIFSMWK